MEHTLTIKQGAEPAALVWFLCSCGSSGSAQKTQGKAIESFQAHVGEFEDAERLERIRAAAPALLEALEGLTPLDWSLNDPMSLKYGRARAAIEATK